MGSPWQMLSRDEHNLICLKWIALATMDKVWALCVHLCSCVGMDEREEQKQEDQLLLRALFLACPHRVESEPTLLSLPLRRTLILSMGGGAPTS